MWWGFHILPLVQYQPAYRSESETIKINSSSLEKGRGKDDKAKWLFSVFGFFFFISFFVSMFVCASERMEIWMSLGKFVFVQPDFYQAPETTS